MKLFFVLFFLLFLTASHNIRKLPEGRIEKDMKYIRSVIDKSHWNVMHEERIIECIVFNAYKKDIPIKILANIPMPESGFRHWVGNSADCYGLFGISYHHWGFLAWQVCDGKYAKYLNKHSGEKEYVIKVMKYIGANTEMATIIIDD
jgi:hypothetical protein